MTAAKRTKPTSARSEDPAAGRPKLQDTIFPHPHQRRVVDDVVAALTRPGGRQMAAVSGPPGVGKSNTLAIVENVLCHRWREEMAADASIRPVVAAEAPPPKDGEFPWRQFFLELLHGLKDPAIERLVGAEEVAGAAPGQSVRPGRLGEDELLGIAKRRYGLRGVRVLLVDEGQHLTAAPGTAALRENLDRLKSFANATGVRIALFGYHGTASGPGVLDIGLASAQLARRIRAIDFPRYRWTVLAEREAFRRTALAMLALVEGLTPELAEASVEGCYERTYGCIGSLHQWLVEAEAAFRSTGMPWAACLASTATDAHTAEASLDEIMAAEARLASSAASRRELRRKLGLDDAPTPPRAAPGKAADGRHPRKPGRRKPTRDEVGSRG